MAIFFFPPELGTSGDWQAVTRTHTRLWLLTVYNVVDCVKCAHNWTNQRLPACPRRKEVFSHSLHTSKQECSIIRRTHQCWCPECEINIRELWEQKFGGTATSEEPREEYFLMFNHFSSTEWTFSTVHSSLTIELFLLCLQVRRVVTKDTEGRCPGERPAHTTSLSHSNSHVTPLNVVLARIYLPKSSRESDVTTVMPTKDSQTGRV